MASKDIFLNLKKEPELLDAAINTLLDDLDDIALEFDEYFSESTDSDNDVEIIKDDCDSSKSESVHSVQTSVKETEKLIENKKDDVCVLKKKTLKSSQNSVRLKNENSVINSVNSCSKSTDNSQFKSLNLKFPRVNIVDVKWTKNLPVSCTTNEKHKSDSFKKIDEKGKVLNLDKNNTIETKNSNNEKEIKQNGSRSDKIDKTKTDNSNKNHSTSRNDQKDSKTRNIDVTTNVKNSVAKTDVNNSKNHSASHNDQKDSKTRNIDVTTNVKNSAVKTDVNSNKNHSASHNDLKDSKNRNIDVTTNVKNSIAKTDVNSNKNHSDSRNDQKDSKNRNVDVTTNVKNSVAKTDVNSSKNHSASRSDQKDSKTRNIDVTTNVKSSVVKTDVNNSKNHSASHNDQKDTKKRNIDVTTNIKNSIAKTDLNSNKNHSASHNDQKDSKNRNIDVTTNVKNSVAKTDVNSSKNHSASHNDQKDSKNRNVDVTTNFKNSVAKTDVNSSKNHSVSRNDQKDSKTRNIDVTTNVKNSVVKTDVNSSKNHSASRNDQKDPKTRNIDVTTNVKNSVVKIDVNSSKNHSVSHNDQKDSKNRNIDVTTNVKNTVAKTDVNKQNMIKDAITVKADVVSSKVSNLNSNNTDLVIKKPKTVNNSSAVVGNDKKNSEVKSDIINENVKKKNENTKIEHKIKEDKNFLQFLDEEMKDVEKIKQNKKKNSRINENRSSSLNDKKTNVSKTEKGKNSGKSILSSDAQKCLEEKHSSDSNHPNGIVVDKNNELVKEKKLISKPNENAVKNCDIKNGTKDIVKKDATEEASGKLLNCNSNCKNILKDEFKNISSKDRPIISKNNSKSSSDNEKTLQTKSVQSLNLVDSTVVSKVNSLDNKVNNSISCSSIIESDVSNIVSNLPKTSGENLVSENKPSVIEDNDDSLFSIDDLRRKSSSNMEEGECPSTDDEDEFMRKYAKYAQKREEKSDNTLWTRRPSNFTKRAAVQNATITTCSYSNAMNPITTKTSSVPSTGIGTAQTVATTEIGIRKALTASITSPCTPSMVINTTSTGLPFLRGATPSVGSKIDMANASPSIVTSLSEISTVLTQRPVEKCSSVISTTASAQLNSSSVISSSSNVANTGSPHTSLSMVMNSSLTQTTPSVVSLKSTSSSTVTSDIAAIARKLIETPCISTVATFPEFSTSAVMQPNTLSAITPSAGANSALPNTCLPTNKNTSATQITAPVVSPSSTSASIVKQDIVALTRKLIEIPCISPVATFSSEATPALMQPNTLSTVTASAGANTALTSMCLLTNKNTPSVQTSAPVISCNSTSGNIVKQDIAALTRKLIESPQIFSNGSCNTSLVTTETLVNTQDNVSSENSTSRITKDFRKEIMEEIKKQMKAIQLSEIPSGNSSDVICSDPPADIGTSRNLENDFPAKGECNFRPNKKATTPIKELEALLPQDLYEDEYMRNEYEKCRRYNSGIEESVRILKEKCKGIDEKLENIKKKNGGRYNKKELEYYVDKKIGYVTKIQHELLKLVNNKSNFEQKRKNHIKKLQKGSIKASKDESKNFKSKNVLKKKKKNENREIICKDKRSGDKKNCERNENLVDVKESNVNVREKINKDVSYIIDKRKLLQSTLEEIMTKSKLCQNLYEGDIKNPVQQDVSIKDVKLNADKPQVITPALECFTQDWSTEEPKHKKISFKINTKEEGKNETDDKKEIISDCNTEVLDMSVDDDDDDNDEEDELFPTLSSIIENESKETTEFLLKELINPTQRSKELIDSASILENVYDSIPLPPSPPVISNCNDDDDLKGTPEKTCKNTVVNNIRSVVLVNDQPRKRKLSEDGFIDNVYNYCNNNNDRQYSPVSSDEISYSGLDKYSSYQLDDVNYSFEKKRKKSKEKVSIKCSMTEEEKEFMAKLSNEKDYELFKRILRLKDKKLQKILRKRSKKPSQSPAVKEKCMKKHRDSVEYEKNETDEKSRERERRYDRSNGNDGMRNQERNRFHERSRSHDRADRKISQDRNASRKKSRSRSPRNMKSSPRNSRDARSSSSSVRSNSRDRRYQRSRSRSPVYRRKTEPLDIRSPSPILKYKNCSIREKLKEQHEIAVKQLCQHIFPDVKRTHPAEKFPRMSDVSYGVQYFPCNDCCYCKMMVPGNSRVCNFPFSGTEAAVTEQLPDFSVPPRPLRTTQPKSDPRVGKDQSQELDQREQAVTSKTTTPLSSQLSPVTSPAPSTSPLKLISPSLHKHQSSPKCPSPLIPQTPAISFPDQSTRPQSQPMVPSVTTPLPTVHPRPPLSLPLPHTMDTPPPPVSHTHHHNTTNHMVPPQQPIPMLPQTCMDSSMTTTINPYDPSKTTTIRQVQQAVNFISQPLIGNGSTYPVLDNSVYTSYSTISQIQDENFVPSNSDLSSSPAVLLPISTQISNESLAQVTSSSMSVPPSRNEIAVSSSNEFRFDPTCPPPGVNIPMFNENLAKVVSSSTSIAPSYKNAVPSINEFRFDPMCPPPSTSISNGNPTEVTSSSTSIAPSYDKNGVPTSNVVYFDPTCPPPVTSVSNENSTKVTSFCTSAPQNHDGNSVLSISDFQFNPAVPPPAVSTSISDENTTKVSSTSECVPPSNDNPKDDEDMIEQLNLPPKCTEVIKTPKMYKSNQSDGDKTVGICSPRKLNQTDPIMLLQGPARNPLRFIRPRFPFPMRVPVNFSLRPLLPRHPFCSPLFKYPPPKQILFQSLPSPSIPYQQQKQKNEKKLLKCKEPSGVLPNSDLQEKHIDDNDGCNNDDGDSEKVIDKKGIIDKINNEEVAKNSIGSGDVPPNNTHDSVKDEQDIKKDSKLDEIQEEFVKISIGSGDVPSNNTHDSIKDEQDIKKDLKLDEIQPSEVIDKKGIIDKINNEEFVKISIGSVDVPPNYTHDSVKDEQDIEKDSKLDEIQPSEVIDKKGIIDKINNEEVAKISMGSVDVPSNTTHDSVKDEQDIKKDSKLDEIQPSEVIDKKGIIDKINNEEVAKISIGSVDVPSNTTHDSVKDEQDIKKVSKLDEIQPSEVINKKGIIDKINNEEVVKISIGSVDVPSNTTHDSVKDEQDIKKVSKLDEIQPSEVIDKKGIIDKINNEEVVKISIGSVGMPSNNDSVKDEQDIKKDLDEIQPSEVNKIYKSVGVSESYYKNKIESDTKSPENSRITEIDKNNEPPKNFKMESISNGAKVGEKRKNTSEVEIKINLDERLEKSDKVSEVNISENDISSTLFLDDDDVSQSSCNIQTVLTTSVESVFTTDDNESENDSSMNRKLHKRKTDNLYATFLNNVRNLRSNKSLNKEVENPLSIRKSSMKRNLNTKDKLMEIDTAGSKKEEALSDCVISCDTNKLNKENCLKTVVSENILDVKHDNIVDETDDITEKITVEENEKNPVSENKRKYISEDARKKLLSKINTGLVSSSKLGLKDLKICIPKKKIKADEIVIVNRENCKKILLSSILNTTDDSNSTMDISSSPSREIEKNFTFKDILSDKISRKHETPAQNSNTFIRNESELKLNQDNEISPESNVLSVGSNDNACDDFNFSSKNNTNDKFGISDFSKEAIDSESHISFKSRSDTENCAVHSVSNDKDKKLSAELNFNNIFKLNKDRNSVKKVGHEPSKNSKKGTSDKNDLLKSNCEKNSRRVTRNSSKKFDIDKNDNENDSIKNVSDVIKAHENDDKSSEVPDLFGDQDSSDSCTSSLNRLISNICGTLEKNENQQNEVIPKKNENQCRNVTDPLISISLNKINENTFMRQTDPEQTVRETVKILESFGEINKCIFRKRKQVNWIGINNNDLLMVQNLCDTKKSKKVKKLSVDKNNLDISLDDMNKRQFNEISHESPIDKSNLLLSTNNSADKHVEISDNLLLKDNIQSEMDVEETVDDIMVNSVCLESQKDPTLPSYEKASITDYKKLPDSSNFSSLEFCTLKENSSSLITREETNMCDSSSGLVSFPLESNSKADESIISKSHDKDDEDSEDIPLSFVLQEVSNEVVNNSNTFDLKKEIDMNSKKDGNTKDSININIKPLNEYSNTSINSCLDKTNSKADESINSKSLDKDYEYFSDIEDIPLSFILKKLSNEIVSNVNTCGLTKEIDVNSKKDGNTKDSSNINLKPLNEDSNTNINSFLDKMNDQDLSRENLNILDESNFTNLCDTKSIDSITNNKMEIEKCKNVYTNICDTSSAETTYEIEVSSGEPNRLINFSSMSGENQAKCGNNEFMSSLRSHKSVIVSEPDTDNRIGKIKIGRQRCTPYSKKQNTKRAPNCPISVSLSTLSSSSPSISEVSSSVGDEVNLLQNAQDKLSALLNSKLINVSKSNKLGGDVSFENVEHNSSESSNFDIDDIISILNTVKGIKTKNNK